MGDGMKDKLASNIGTEIHSKDFHPGLKKNVVLVFLYER